MGLFKALSATPWTPGNGRAAVRFMLSGKTCEPLQLVLVWRWNNSGCRPSAYDLAKLDNSCVLVGANKPPQGLCIFYFSLRPLPVCTGG